VFALAFLGLLMATWNFYLIIVRGQGPMGRFIMLTYNLSTFPALTYHERMAHSAPRHVPKNRAYPVVLEAPIVMEHTNMDTKFAIKVGAGAALYALPSFLQSTRPFYSHWRGEWGLLSYMLVSEEPQ
jgi:hypothetical protein